MSRRPDRSLTDRERQIVGAVARHRVLTGAQIQRWFFPIVADGSRAGALRRTQRCCHRLVTEGVLDSLDRQIGGVRAGSSGFCFVLGPRGQRLVDPGRRSRRINSLGAAYVAHALAAAEVEVGLVEDQRSGAIERFDVEPEPTCWRPFTGAAGQRIVVKPDLFAAVHKGELERRWFIEVDRATVSLVRVETKCRLYLDYLRSGEEQRRFDVFPKVLWTVPTEKRANQVRATVSGLPPPADRLFDVCLDINTNDHLKGGAT